MEYTRKQLLDNAKESGRILSEQGFEVVCSALAGLDSGTTYIHPDGRIAKTRVRNGNRIEYFEHQ